jgi:hypothetical protein
MRNSKFSHYNESNSYYNGKKIRGNKQYMKYDGNKLELLENDNGEISYQTLSNNDIYNMLINKSDNNENLENRLNNILILKKVERQNKNNKSNKKVTKRKRCKKGSRRNRITKRCRKIKNIAKSVKSKNLTKNKNSVKRQLKNYIPDKMKTIW